MDTNESPSMTKNPTPARDAVEEAMAFANALERNFQPSVRNSAEDMVIVLRAEIVRLTARAENEQLKAGSLKAANARIREMELAQAWQPIETAPRDGKEFVVAYAYQGFVKQLVNFNTIHHCWQSKGKMLLGFATNATHWLALPAPPSEAKDDGRGE